MVQSLPVGWQSGFGVNLEKDVCQMHCAYNKISGRCMVLSCFSWYGLGPFILIHGELNANSYCTFQDNNEVPTLEQFYGLDQCYFQEDNASFMLLGPRGIDMMTIG
ncbi:hypothetical protein TNCV_2479651 [Trichonephila clavipes]|nr:hypothetical protein TNCV_2479651 [Trichonephila clavipes]